MHVIGVVLKINLQLRRITSKLKAMLKIEVYLAVKRSAHYSINMSNTTRSFLSDVNRNTDWSFSVWDSDYFK